MLLSFKIRQQHFYFVRNNCSCFCISQYFEEVHIILEINVVKMLIVSCLLVFQIDNLLHYLKDIAENNRTCKEKPTINEYVLQKTA